MGIAREGIIGRFTKKVGNISGALWRNKNIIKTLPRPSSKPATQEQLDQRFIFGMMTAFLSYLSGFIERFYIPKSPANSGMNEAVSYNIKNAVTGMSPSFEIDYSKLKLSTGRLESASTFDAVPEPGGKMKFTWSEDGINDDQKNGSDVINLLVYNPTIDRFGTMMSAAPRSAKEVVMQLSPDMVGTEVHCYFNFSSTKKKKLNSKSVYIGLREVE